MSALALVIAIAMPIALILFGMVMYGRHKQKIQTRLLQAGVVRTKMEELQESLEFLMSVDNNKELQLDVLSRLEQLFQLYLDTLPSKSSITQESAQAADSGNPVGESDPDFEAMRLKIEQGREIRTSLKSDREIRMAKQHVSRLLRTLSAMTKRRLISPTVLDDYRRYLRIMLLEREVDTYREQGDVAAQRDDIITAGNYYKAARKLLIEFDIQYPDKNDRIRELTERSNTLFNGGVPKKDKLTQGLEKEKTSEEEAANGLSEPGEKRTF